MDHKNIELCAISLIWAPTASIEIQYLGKQNSLDTGIQVQGDYLDLLGPPMGPHRL